MVEFGENMFCVDFYIIWWCVEDMCLVINVWVYCLWLDIVMIYVDVVELMVFWNDGDMWSVVDSFG